MRSASARKSLSSKWPRWIRWSTSALSISSAIFVISLAAQTPTRYGGREAPPAASSDATAPIAPTAVSAPNYALEARFLPDSSNKLVFDLSVTPHWFTLSDKFWHSYRTRDATKYYAADPLNNSKSPLCANAKIR